MKKSVTPSRFKNMSCSLMCVGLLSGCSGLSRLFQAKKIPVQGVRTALYAPEFKETEKAVFSVDKLRSTLISAQQWPQPGLNSNHHMGAFALNGEPSWSLHRVWKRGVSRGVTLPVAPVSTTDRIFIMDHAGFLSALDWNGRTLWSVQVNREKNTYGMGGGLATDGERVYVTTPHKWVLALDCASGKVLWSYRLMHPARNGLAISGNRLALLTLGNQTIVLDACTGKEVWDDQGMKEDTLILGGSIPAVTRDRVIVASVSGEIMALSLDSGDRLWDRPLATISSAEGEKNFRHLQAYPVVVGSQVYATSDHGHIMCCDLYSGDVIWSRDAGGMQTPIVVGDVLIALTSMGHCVAMDRHTGKEYWTIVLPKLKPESNRWFGPVMAGNVLYVLSSNGQLCAYDPYQKGNLISQQFISDGYTMAPIPVNGGLLLFSENGYLSFYQRKFTKNTCKVVQGKQ
ncbi:MAG: hypothetical protein FJX00_02365 [Alphaproteobacteria bacterium]|nr:hypothetical protein [Alphaproteobacteria bacterium]